jgi:hypothetical protein
MMSSRRELVTVRRKSGDVSGARTFASRRTRNSGAAGVRLWRVDVQFANYGWWRSYPWSR